MTRQLQQQKIQEDPRVGLLSLIIRLGHESFKRKDIKSKISYILNNSRVVSPYDRSCLIDCTSSAPRIVGVTGEESVNQNSEYAILIRDLVFPVIKGLNKLTELNRDHISTCPESKELYSFFDKYLSKTPGASIYLIPLLPPEGAEREGLFIWVVEFFKAPDETEKHKLGLLSQGYAESLWYGMNSSPNLYNTIKEKTKKKRNLFIIFGVLLITILLFTYHLDLNVSSDFEIESTNSELEYAPFAGKIEEVYVRTGENVTKNQLLLKYETDEFLYDLAEAKASYNETAAKLDMTRQKSFNDPAALPEIKILDLQKEKERIKINKIKWYLDHSLIKAQIAGKAVIEDEKELEGKAVQPGEKLLEIASNENLIAKIYLNETDAAVLEKITSITLYLHSRPEKGIRASSISISPKAEYSDNRKFCFTIKASFDNKNKDIVYGMRGTARIGGEKVSLGYYLIRNIIIWWRKV